MTVAAYIRVSTKAQDHAMQRSAIEGRGVKVERWYAEKASAKTTDRAELKRLLADVRAGLVTEVWVFRLDRLARSGVADMFRVVGEIRSAGASLHSVAENLTIKPEGDITSDVLIFAFGLAAQVERVAINDRIAAARVHTEAKGGTWGRTPRMTGNERETALRLKGEGRTVREIAAALGVPKSTVGRLLAA